MESRGLAHTGDVVSEKNLPPSHQRLVQARQEGQLGVSQDLIKLVKFGVIAEAAFAMEPLFRQQMSDLWAAGFFSLSQDRAVRMQVMVQAMTPLLGIGLVLALVAGWVAWGMTLLQTGFNVASKALEKGPQKLNPVSNLKQIFSSQKLIMLGLGPLKIGSVLFVLSVKMQSWIPALLEVDRLMPSAIWHLTLELLRQLERTSLIVLAAWAVFDVALQRWQTYRSLRMNIQEVKQDYKNSEGDPHVKGHRKSTAKQILMDNSTPKLPKPTAVVVNPQHIAIAMSYHFQPDTLPLIVAKGRNEQAQSIRDMAAREGIPIIRYKGLARQLYATARIGEFVQPDALRAVALLYQAVRELSQEEGALSLAGVYELDEGMAEALLHDI